MSYNLSWDGTYLGDVTILVKTIELETNFVLVTFTNNEQAYMFKFENNIPLIADELKPLFGLVKVGRNSATINNNKVILCRKIGTEFNYGEKDQTILSNLQRIYIFRWTLGFVITSQLRKRVLNNGISFILSYSEVSINYDKNNNRRSHIPDKYLYLFPDGVDSVVKNMFTKDDFSMLRFKIENTIRRIDQKYVWWTNDIIERMSNKFI